MGLRGVCHYGFNFIYISLIISDVDHIFIHLLTICIYFLEKWLFKSFAHF